MFSWIWKWLSKPRTLDVYAPRERLIWSYFDGIRQVRADPLVLWKRLMDQGPELSIDIKVAGSASKDAGKASDAVTRKIRDIFSLQPLKNGLEVEGTLTDAECCDLLDTFMEWCESIKKKSRPSVTSSRPTEDSTSSSAEGPTTEPSSGSGSTGSGPSSEDQGQSRTVSPSLWVLSPQESPTTAP